jgi:NAD(P)-dependent dehydrogenase (short-subunit alcohol dehydrogenase family)
MESLDGRVAIVTGAASGIGKAIVETFARADVSGVVLVDVQARRAEEVAAAVRETHGTETLVAAIDVSKQDLVNKMVEDTVAKFGRVDILVNNAGICPLRSWDDTTLEDWNHILDVNLTSAFLCTKAALPHMRENKYGRIVMSHPPAPFLAASWRTWPMGSARPA